MVDGTRLFFFYHFNFIYLFVKDTAELESSWFSFFYPLTEGISLDCLRGSRKSSRLRSSFLCIWKHWLTTGEMFCSWTSIWNSSLYLYIILIISFLSSSDDSCRFALITTIETVHIKDLVVNVVIKVLGACMKLSQGMENSKLRESGSQLSVLMGIPYLLPSQSWLNLTIFVYFYNLHQKL